MMGNVVATMIGPRVVIERAIEPLPEPTRGERILDAIEDEVAQRLAAYDEHGNELDCWHCGGEGYTFDCIDGCCVDADVGCEDCSRDCPECRLRAGEFAKAVRLEVLKLLDIDVAIAWARQKGRWREDMLREFVLFNLHAQRSRCDAFTAEERADSCCWLEGLL